MTKHIAAIRTLAVSAILLALPANAAFAQDVTAVADRLKALVEKQGMSISWSNITGDASTMTLEGVTVKQPGETDALPIGNLTLSDVTEKDGGFRVGTLATAPFSMADQGFALDVSPFVFGGLSLPAEASTDPMAGLMMSESAALDSLSVKMAGKTVFSLQNATGNMSPADGSGPLTFSGGVEKFTADLTAVEDANVKGYIQALGYSQLDGNVRMEGSWRPSDGHWDMPQYDITVNDVGSLGMTLDLGGLTPEFLKKVNELSTQAAADGGTGNSQKEMELLGMLSSAMFNGASLRFSDDSLTSRIINLVASLQGAQPADVVNMAKGAVPFALMQAEMADLAGEITPAINAYLDNPNSIEIVARPSTPVSFAEIGAASMATPSDSIATTKALWSLLGIQLKANQ
ncbi:MAG: hypothetical protein KF810_11290 [Rhizobiaceae bacterium]|nr:hypothetical protein [Rhizobiaceae bacterium]